MTEVEWLTKPEADLRVTIGALDVRRQRLLAVAACRALGSLVDFPEARAAFEVIETFADTRKTKAALRRARQSVNNLRGTLESSPDVPRVSLPLFTIQMAASENAVSGTVALVLEILARGEGGSEENARRQVYALYREIAGDPSRRPFFSPSWRTSTTLALAKQMYESRDFGAMPILADALQDAGCDDGAILNHCRDANQIHARGCWVIDLVLDKT